MKEFDSAAGRSCSCNAQVAASVRATGNVVDDMKFLEIYRYELFGLDVVANSEVRRCYGEIPDNFKSQAHHWNKEKIFKIDDDLPKFLDGPKEFGLSGIMVDSDGNPIEESAE
jgi:hypothetical protein